jgi:hypothetical protein
MTIAIIDSKWPFPAADPSSLSTWPAAPSLEGIDDNSVWRPHLSLDKILIEVVAKAVCDCNHNHLFPSRSDENYPNPKAAYDRLQNRVMSKGFAVVQQSKERIAAVKAALATEKAAEKKRIAAEKDIIAAAKIAEDERVKKAQEVVRIDQEEAKIARRIKEILQNAIEVVILLILLNNPIWN